MCVTGQVGGVVAHNTSRLTKNGRDAQMMLSLQWKGILHVFDSLKCIKRNIIGPKVLKNTKIGRWHNCRSHVAQALRPNLVIESAPQRRPELKPPSLFDTDNQFPHMLQLIIDILHQVRFRHARIW